MLYKALFLLLKIDAILTEQLNLILHHARFQQLEASWKGLAYLAAQTNTEKGFVQVKIKLLNLSWQEIIEDLGEELIFDQTQLFDKIYNEAFGLSGGEPFGLLVGNYSITPECLPILRKISRIAAASLCPFISQADSTLFGLKDYWEFLEVSEISPYLKMSPIYQKWDELRKDENANFLALVLPSVKMRAPYNKSDHSAYLFPFEESLKNPEDILLASTVYILAAKIAQSFLNTGWFFELTSCLVVEKDELPRSNYGIDTGVCAMDFVVQPLLSTKLESILSFLGFIVLSEKKYEENCVFYHDSSIKRPNEKARNFYNLSYLLCACRFAHFLKIIARNKIGGFLNATSLEEFLQNWLQAYISSNTDSSEEMRMKYPLRAAQIKIIEDEAGSYLGFLELSPHYYFEYIFSSVHLCMAIEYNAHT